MGITTHRYNHHCSTSPTTNISISTTVSSVPSSTSTNTTTTSNILSNPPFSPPQAANSATNNNSIKAIDQHDDSIHSAPQTNNSNNNNIYYLPFGIHTILSDQENERSRTSVAFSSVITSKSVAKSNFQFESHSTTNKTLREYYHNVTQNAKHCLNLTESKSDSVLYAVSRNNDFSVTVPYYYYLCFNNNNNNDGISNNSESIPKSAASLFNPYHHPTVITSLNSDPVNSDSSKLNSHPITNPNTNTNTKLISHSKTNFIDHNLVVASNYYDNIKNNDKNNSTHQKHSHRSDDEEDNDDNTLRVSKATRKHSSTTVISLPSTTSNIRRVGHPYQSRAPAKHKKPRTSFSKKQVALLENRFLSQKYLASTERASLAIELDMSDAQVKTWFQNRRTKWRRQEAEEKEFEDKANARMLSSYRQCFFARPDITL